MSIRHGKQAYARLATLMVLLVMLCGMFGCKTNQKNMNDAYTQAMAGRDNDDLGLDSTIYSRYRKQMTHGTMMVGGDTVEVSSQWVKVTENGGGKREDLQRYNVVVGQFKQIFNAKSLRSRLIESGYPDCFIVETAEPYYFIVAASFADATQAVKCLREIEANTDLKLKKPLPFILEPTQRRY